VGIERYFEPIAKESLLLLSPSLLSPFPGGAETSELTELSTAIPLLILADSFEPVDPTKGGELADGGAACIALSFEGTGRENRPE
jgi:hypothetical protein